MGSVKADMGLTERKIVSVDDVIAAVQKGNDGAGYRLIPQMAIEDYLVQELGASYRGAREAVALAKWCGEVVAVTCLESLRKKEEAMNIHAIDTITMFTYRQLANRWGVSEGSIRRMAENGSLCVVSLGERLPRIPIGEVERLEKTNGEPVKTCPKCGHQL